MISTTKMDPIYVPCPLPTTLSILVTSSTINNPLDILRNPLNLLLDLLL